MTASGFVFGIRGSRASYGGPIVRSNDHASRPLDWNRAGAVRSGPVHPSSAGMAIETPEFRRVLGHWPTGVAVVTARGAEGLPNGLTANAITSVSLDPPLVLVCVNVGADTHAAIEGSGRFAINVLPAEAESLARRFADHGRLDKFQGVGWRAEISGAPVLDRALAWVDCAVVGAYPGGDHTVFVGRVLGADGRSGEPLLFYRGGYGRVTR